jgi:predicted  nucleic acid-binding Zn-ribbon protein
MAKSAAQKNLELQEELDEANERIEELEEHIRTGADLLHIEDLEDALEEAESEEDHEEEGD